MADWWLTGGCVQVRSGAFRCVQVARSAEPPPLFDVVAVKGRPPVQTLLLSCLARLQDTYTHTHTYSHSPQRAGEEGTLRDQRERGLGGLPGVRSANCTSQSAGGVARGELCPALSWAGGRIGAASLPMKPCSTVMEAVLWP